MIFRNDIALNTVHDRYNLLDRRSRSIAIRAQTASVTKIRRPNNWQYASETYTQRPNNWYQEPEIYISDLKLAFTRRSDKSNTGHSMTS